MNNLEKGKNFIKDFDSLKDESAAHVRNKLWKYNKQRLEFSVPNSAMFPFFFGNVVFKPEMKFSGVLAGIWKRREWNNNKYHWIIEFRDVILLNGDVPLTRIRLYGLELTELMGVRTEAV